MATSPKAPKALTLEEALEALSRYEIETKPHNDNVLMTVESLQIVSEGHTEEEALFLLAKQYIRRDLAQQNKRNKPK